jgi:hypothetical protein
MKTARMAIEQFRMQNAPSYAIIKITNAEGDVAEKCKELGYQTIAFDEFWAKIYTNEDLAKYRNPFIEMIKNGMITK